MQRTFQFVITWAEASKKVREIRELGIPYEIESTSNGMVVIYMPDLLHRVYNSVRAIFNNNELRGL